MKKLAVLLMTLACAFALCACGNTDQPADQPTDQTKVEDQQTPTDADATAPTDTTAPTDEQTPTDAPTDAPDAGTDKPAE